MHTITDMARHYGVFPATITYHINRGKLPHPNTLPKTQTITQSLSDIPYPGRENTPKGPGIRGGKSKQIYGDNYNNIAAGKNGITKIATHLNLTTQQTTQYINEGKIPDPRIKAVNITTLKRPKNKPITQHHINQAIQERQNNTHGGILQKIAYLEDKIDLIINHLLNLQTTIG